MHIPSRQRARALSPSAGNGSTHICPRLCHFSSVATFSATFARLCPNPCPFLCRLWPRLHSRVLAVGTKIGVSVGVVLVQLW